MTKYTYGQITFFDGSNYLGYLNYVRPTRRALRYSIDWANRADKYYSWTTAVYWFRKTKVLILHRDNYDLEIKTFYLTY